MFADKKALRFYSNNKRRGSVTIPHVCSSFCNQHEEYTDSYNWLGKRPPFIRRLIFSYQVLADVNRCLLTHNYTSETCLSLCLSAHLFISVSFYTQNH